MSFEKLGWRVFTCENSFREILLSQKQTFKKKILGTENSFRTNDSEMLQVKELLTQLNLEKGSHKYKSIPRTIWTSKTRISVNVWWEIFNNLRNRKFTSSKRSTLGLIHRSLLLWFLRISKHPNLFSTKLKVNFVGVLIPLTICKKKITYAFHVVYTFYIFLGVRRLKEQFWI